MSTIVAGEYHDMTIRHPTAGLKLPNWTTQLFKNGSLVKGTPVEVVESPSKTYTFSFKNDGDHNTTWCLVVYETNLPGIAYSESWRVQQPIIEKALAYLTGRFVNAK